MLVRSYLQSVSRFDVQSVTTFLLILPVSDNGSTLGLFIFLLVFIDEQSIDVGKNHKSVQGETSEGIDLVAISGTKTML